MQAHSLEVVADHKVDHHAGSAISHALCLLHPVRKPPRSTWMTGDVWEARHAVRRALRSAQTCARRRSRFVTVWVWNAWCRGRSKPFLNEATPVVLDLQVWFWRMCQARLTQQRKRLIADAKQGWHDLVVLLAARAFDKGDVRLLWNIARRARRWKPRPQPQLRTSTGHVAVGAEEVNAVWADWLCKLHQATMVLDDDEVESGLATLLEEAHLTSVGALMLFLLQKSLSRRLST